MEKSITTSNNTALKLEREEFIASDVQALIFDFDGLLVDTETCMFKAWEALLKTYDVEVSPLQVAGLVGSSVPATSLYQLFNQASHQALSNYDIRQLVEEKAYRLIETISEREGVRQYLEFAKSKNWKIALATSSEFKHYHPILSRLNLTHFFDCFVGAEDIVPAKRKPQPDVYLAALNQLGVSAHQAIAFEDSPPGVQAARSAGIPTVAVTNLLTCHLDVSLANVVMSSMNDQTLPQLLNQLMRNEDE
ncbi:HAD family phosphatase [Photobacterium sp. NCIMB 13483]|uniref:Phosphorylated carbohydrates phosphatase n=1 Tax=Photobacterium piscicola TaxID=1378299 RepID=A0A1T5I537_9GAMM|nr:MULTISPECIES: HAD family phosphatase [Photobacterium]PST87364.1 HAD family phosphatase [Photobacterium sp. NCIMB 13483]SKC34224.1 Phosphorylated carbohydrates phosphatase [Photobacterium piscicola]